MTEFLGYIANCLVKGNEITTTPTGSTRDTIRLSIGGFELELKQHKDIATGNWQQHNGHSLHTTDVIAKDIEKDNIPQLEIALDDLCWLLSFASLSRVIYFGYEYPRGSGFKKLTSVMGVASYFRPTLPTNDGTVVRNFVHKVFDTYINIKDKRSLNVVIDYLVQAERPGQPREVQLILAFIALECLKNTYAREKSIPYERGYFRKLPKPKKGRDYYTFEELLKKMFLTVGMRKGLKKIVRLRNEIIHSGISRIPPSAQSSLYERTHDIIREYILRLLGYNGEYCKYTGPDYGKL